MSSRNNIGRARHPRTVHYWPEDRTKSACGHGAYDSSTDRIGPGVSCKMCLKSRLYKSALIEDAKRRLK